MDSDSDPLPRAMLMVPGQPVLGQKPIAMHRLVRTSVRTGLPLGLERLLNTLRNGMCGWVGSLFNSRVAMWLVCCLIVGVSWRKLERCLGTLRRGKGVWLGQSLSLTDPATWLMRCLNVCIPWRQPKGESYSHLGQATVQSHFGGRYLSDHSTSRAMRSCCLNVGNTAHS